MPRRVNLPGAEELFRPTQKNGQSGKSRSDNDEHEATSGGVDSGRIKHDEKMTVYLTSEELLALEQARLQLRAQLGRTVDRGRFVRAALAETLADLERHGTDSAVAKRLSQS